MHIGLRTVLVTLAVAGFGLMAISPGAKAYLVVAADPGSVNYGDDIVLEVAGFDTDDGPPGTVDEAAFEWFLTGGFSLGTGHSLFLTYPDYASLFPAPGSYEVLVRMDAVYTCWLADPSVCGGLELGEVLVIEGVSTDTVDLVLEIGPDQDGDAIPDISDPCPTDSENLCTPTPAGELPEPGMLGLWASGIAVVALLRRRRAV